MQFQPGNTESVKLKTPELKQMAYKQYCDHIASGYTKKSWRFRHPEISLTWETMEKYIKNDPDFDPIHKKVAECDSLFYWETVLAKSATGENEKANTASLQIIMRNKFGWDTKEHKEADEDEGVVESHEKLMKQLKAAQAVSLSQVSISAPSP